MSKKLYAVLTGDVVRSSKLTSAELDRLFEVLAEAVREAGGWDASLEHTQFYRYRGDGWQLVLREPRWALRLCLFLRASLKAADPQFATRIAVGIGGVDHLDETNLAASSGEAFELSGQLLEGMSKSTLFDAAEHDWGPVPTPFLSSIFALCDAISDQWTRRQAQIVSFALRPNAPDQRQIGRLLSPQIAQSTVARHLSNSGVEALLTTFQAFESTRSKARASSDRRH